jgi:hypothetical protein
MPSSRAQSSPSLLGLLGILASVFALFAWLKVKPIDPQTKEVNSNKNTGHTPQKPAPVLASESCIPKTVCHQEEAATERRKVPDWLKFVVNVLTLAAVTWYACEARKQRVAMDHTFEQVQKQTTLQRQQLVGTQGAVVTLNGTPVWDTENQRLTVNVVNRGGVTGMITSFRAILQRKRLRDQTPIGDPVTMQIYNREMPKAEGVDLGKGLPWPLPQVKDQRKWPGDEIVTMSGQYSYTNGFDDTISHDFCFLWIPPWNLQPPIQGAPSSGGQWQGGTQGCPTVQEEVDKFLRAKKRFDEMTTTK